MEFSAFQPLTRLLLLTFPLLDRRFLVCLQSKDDISGILYILISCTNILPCRVTGIVIRPNAYLTSLTFDLVIESL